MAEKQDLVTLLGKTFKGTVVEDPVLEPYFVVRYAEGGFGVIKKRTDDSGKLRIRVLSYPSTFVGCLHYIAKEQLNVGGSVYSSIQQYIDDWKKITTRILEAYKEWNVESI